MLYLVTFSGLYAPDILVSWSVYRSNSNFGFLQKTKLYGL